LIASPLAFLSFRNPPDAEQRLSAVRVHRPGGPDRVWTCSNESDRATPRAVLATAFATRAKTDPRQYGKLVDEAVDGKIKETPSDWRSTNALN